MNEQELFIYKRIINDMAEGVITIGFDGIISSINPACEKILMVNSSIVGSSFAATFFEYDKNDSFNQCILDAIYESTGAHNNVVNYFNGNNTKKLFITTSYLKSGNKKQGVIVVINDVSELFELKDAVKAMEKIKALNAKLEIRNKLISETFGRYLSDEIVKNLLDTPDGLRLGGRKEVVTILMSDLRGFTAMSELMNPAELIKMLNNYLREMTEIVQKYNGTIIEFIGDAIFAIFGQPIESGKHETNAVTCAVKMQNRMKKVNDYNEKNSYPRIEMGIGINTGEVILGNIGSEKRAKYGVVGQNVNLAGRIESFTVGGQVLISQSTLEKIKTIGIRGQQEIYPKGVLSPITIYDVSSVGRLKLDAEEEIFTYLENPIKIRFTILEGKFEKGEGINANITSVSKHEAFIDIDCPKSTNIKFLCGGKEVFAKYVGEKKIHVTMGKII